MYMKKMKQKEKIYVSEKNETKRKKMCMNQLRKLYNKNKN